MGSEVRYEPGMAGMLKGFLKGGMESLNDIIVRNLRSDICREIQESGNKQITAQSMTMVTMPLTIFDKTMLKPEFYIPAVQAEMVGKCLKSATTAEQIRSRLRSMIRHQGFKSNGEIFRLNSITLAVLRKYI